MSREAADAGLDVVRWFVRRTRAIRRIDALERSLADAAEELGFSYYALVHHGRLASGSATRLDLTNYPMGWRTRFIAQELHRIDPVQRACNRTAAGFRWSRLDGLMPLSAQQREVLRASRRHGVGDGFTVPLHLPGERAASCSFAVEPGAPLPTLRLDATQLLGLAAFNAARALIPHRSAAAMLSPRQQQCIALLANGLTDRGIARRLGLSEETVTKYLNAARRRYGLARRAQLVAVALQRGEIGFDDILPG